MQIRTIAVEDTSFLHLRSANDELLYEQKEVVKENGATVLVDDTDKPVGITLYSPGTKEYAKAQAAKNNRMLDRLKRLGKSELTADDLLKENVKFLTACTEQMHNIENDGLEGEALAKAVYGNTKLGFIAEQALKHLGAWENFTSGSTKT